MNRSVIQKVTDGRFDYPIISPEAMRNALRETLGGPKYKLPVNRVRLDPVSGKGKSEEGGDGDKQQLAVKFAEYPDPTRYADDFFFGYLLAVKGNELNKLRQAKGSDFPLKRDSVLRMNLAKALEPYRHNAVFTQSPQIKDSPWKPGGGDQRAESALLHRETAVTAFQFPFALNLNDCKAKPDWTKKLLRAIGELNDVAGNHARSYYEMAPASIIVRLTELLVAGYNTYGFQSTGQAPNEVHTFPEVIHGILHDPPDYPPSEFYLGGKIVKDMEPKKQDELAKRGVTLERDPRALLATVADKAIGR